MVALTSKLITDVGTRVPITEPHPVSPENMISIAAMPKNHTSLRSRFMDFLRQRKPSQNIGATAMSTSLCAGGGSFPDLAIASSGSAKVTDTGTLPTKDVSEGVNLQKSCVGIPVQENVTGPGRLVWDESSREKVAGFPAETVAVVGPIGVRLKSIPGMTTKLTCAVAAAKSPEAA